MEGDAMCKAGSSAVRLVALLLFVNFCGGRAMADSSYSLKSPDNRIEVQIHVAKKISYDVLLNGKTLLKDSTLAINMDGKTLGRKTAWIKRWNLSFARNLQKSENATTN